MNERERAVQLTVDVETVSGLAELLTPMSVDQLVEDYGLTFGNASMVWDVIHDNDPDRCTYRLKDERAVEFLHMVQESIHQGHDGYTEHERCTIRAFLSDITFAINTDA